LKTGAYYSVINIVPVSMSLISLSSPPNRFILEQAEENRGQLEDLHALETDYLVREHNAQLENIRNAANQQRLVYEATIQQLELDAESTVASLSQREAIPNKQNGAFGRAIVRNSYACGN